MALYKVLHEDGRVFHGGTGSWHLPKGNRPGKWMPLIENISACRRGYHVCEPQDLLKWLGPAIFEVEIRGTQVRDSNKTVAQQARLIRKCEWNGKIAASFALDCATRALNAEKKAGRTPDPRLYAALKVARDFLNGKATQDEVTAAASAARSAASAARSAARSAASAARSAEIKWQNKRLLEYVAGRRVA